VHIDFKYDYQGRRISKMDSNWNGSAFAEASETRYAYEHWNLVADYSVSGSTLSLSHGYVWGIDLSGRRNGAGGVGGLLAMVAASGAIELPVYDANGNVQGLTDRNTGQLTAAYEYSPYGELLRATGAYAQMNSFQFSSKYTDIETGFVYYGHRYYNPVLGRFFGRDPSGEKGGLHLYAFTQNDPIGKWDNLGLFPPNANAPYTGPGPFGVAWGLIAGSLQLGGGIAVDATVGWTGVGAVGGTLMAVNGAATLTSSIGNALSLMNGNATVLNQSGIVGLVSSGSAAAFGGLLQRTSWTFPQALPPAAFLALAEE
jgi:RHS repeat-associated protein